MAFVWHRLSPALGLEIAFKVNAPWNTHATNDLSEPVRIAVSNGSRFPDGFGVNFPLTFFPHANGDCRRPQPDENTVRLFFYSEADNLVANDDNGVGDIFCYFREDRIVRISEGADGSSFNAATSVGQPTFDGRYYVFATEASKVVPGDSNGVSDVFLKDVDTGQITLLSAGLDGQPANGPSTNPTVDHYADRTYFSSSATNLVENDNNGMTDIFVYDRAFSRVIGRINFDLDGTPPHGGSNSPQLCSASRMSYRRAGPWQERNASPGLASERKLTTRRPPCQPY